MATRTETVFNVLSARFLEEQKSGGNEGFPLNRIVAPIYTTYINGLNVRRFANQFGSMQTGGSVQYTRKVKKDINLIAFDDYDGQPTKDNGTLNANFKLKYQEILITNIFTDIELTISEKEKFKKDDLTDSGMTNLVAITLADIMELYEIDMQERRDALLKATATASSHVKEYNFGEYTEDGNGEAIYRAIQKDITELNKQGMPGGEANVFHNGINRTELIVEVNTWIAQALQNYLAFVNTKLNKDPHLFRGVMDSETPGAQPVMVEDNTFLGMISGVAVYENKMFGRDNSDVDSDNWTEDYYVVYKKGSYGLPFRSMETKMGPTATLSFMDGLNTLARYGLGAIWPETIIFAIKDGTLTPTPLLSSAELKVQSTPKEGKVLKMLPIKNDIYNERMLATAVSKAIQVKELNDKFGKKPKMLNIGNLANNVKEQSKLNKIVENKTKEMFKTTEKELVEENTEQEIKETLKDKLNI